MSGVSPFVLMKHLQELQMREFFTYELQQEVFVVQVYRVKRDQELPEMAIKLLEIVRRIERNSIDKLNCMYIAA